MEHFVTCRDCRDAQRWTIHVCIDHLHKGSNKKRFQYCLNSDGVTHYMRAIQGHSEGNKVDPLLLDSVDIPYNWNESFITLVLLSICILLSIQD